MNSSLPTILHATAGFFRTRLEMLHLGNLSREKQVRNGLLRLFMLAQAILRGQWH